MKKKTVTYKVTNDKNYGLKEKMEIRPGKCPCSACGHKTMEECNRANCQCCSSACT